MAVAGLNLIVEVAFDPGGLPFTPGAGNYTGTLEIGSPAWSNTIQVSLQAQIVSLTLACPPTVKIKQNGSASITLMVSAQGAATPVDIQIFPALSVAGVSAVIEPASLPSLAAWGAPQPVVVTFTAAPNATPSVTTVTLLAGGFGTLEFGSNLEFSTKTTLTISALVLQNSPINAKYAAFPNASTILGEPIGPEAFCLDFVAQYRAYQHGVIYWSGSAGDAAYEIHEPILTPFLTENVPDWNAPPNSPTPTLGDYEAAAGAGSCPITDVTVATAGCYESRFQG